MNIHQYAVKYIKYSTANGSKQKKKYQVIFV